MGNPPWDEATVEEDSFWARYVAGLGSKTQREQEAIKQELRRDRPDLVTQYRQELVQAELIRRLLVSGPFPGMGTGDPDLYKAFVWRFWALVNRPNGRIGVVLPRSLFSSKGGKDFRHQILTTALVGDLTFLINAREWVFDDVGERYTIALMVVQKIKPDSLSKLPMRGPYSDGESFIVGCQRQPHYFELEDVLGWTDTAALPLLPDAYATDIFVQMRRFPNLGLDDKESWRARPYRELDATNDKKYMEMNNDPEPERWPVYKGESFNHWHPDTGKYYAWAKPAVVLERLCSKRRNSSRSSSGVFREFPSEWVADTSTYPAFKPRVAFPGYCSCHRPSDYCDCADTA